MVKKSIGATNKRKGSNAERLYAKKFRELGFEFCKTSRFVSKAHDNSKIDLMYIPFNIQIKAGVQKGLNAGKELMSMEAMIKTMFPPTDEVFTKPALLIHYVQVGPGRKREAEHEKVFMSHQQFLTFKQMNPDLKFDTEKVFKFESISEFKHIVCMTFEYFVEEVILKFYKP